MSKFILIFSLLHSLVSASAFAQPSSPKIKVVAPSEISIFDQVSEATSEKAAEMGLMSLALPKRMQLTWTDSGGEQGYRIERKTTASGTFGPAGSTGPDITTFIDSDAALVSGQTYCYRVQAYNASGSANSNELCNTLPADPSYTVSVNRTGNGQGSVNSNPAGIQCGTDCSELFVNGTMVTLTATPQAGSLFSGWSGGGCSGTGTCHLTVSADTSVTAQFSLPIYTLSVARSGTGSGTITSSPAGVNCGTDCSEPYSSGTIVILTATPATGSVFGGWSGGGCSGTGTCTVVIGSNATVTAQFNPPDYTLTLTKSGNGSGSVVSSPVGISCGTDCNQLYSRGTSITLTATPASGSLFSGWSGGGCSGTGACSLSLTANTTVNASFSLPNYTLSVTKAGQGLGNVMSAPSGISCGADCTEPYASGSAVTLSASGLSGSTFQGWSGAGCSGTGGCSVTMTSDQSVTATFVPPSYNLTLSKTGNGSGVVTSAPTGINCGTDCSEFYNSGTMVTLTAAPATGSQFAGWSGGGCAGLDPCTVTMTAATSVTANFTLQSLTLSVTKTGAGQGTVMSQPAGINCGAACNSNFAYGSSVVLTATPASGSVFLGWSGGGCSGANACTVTLTASTSVSAQFAPQQYQLRVNKIGSGFGKVVSQPVGIDCGADCSESYNRGTNVTLTATAEMGSVFNGWTGACTGSSLTCTLTVNSVSDVTASFVVPTSTLTVSQSGTGSGVIISSPGGINCGTDCTEVFSTGIQVTLAASPAAGSKFLGWGGDCFGNDVCTVVMDSNKTVSAVFAVPQVVTAINSGGPLYTSKENIRYVKDVFYSGGSSALKSVNIKNTSDPVVYHTVRRGTFSYKIPVPNGDYTVVLKFAETQFTGPGKRKFNVDIEGRRVLTNFDVAAQAGVNTALDLSFPVSVSDGVLNLFFDNVLRRAFVSAIVVYSDTLTTTQALEVFESLKSAEVEFEKAEIDELNEETEAQKAELEEEP